MANKILFITLSNIGDAILTLPVLDFLREKDPYAKITVMSGPRPAELFEKNPYIDRFIAYDKHAPFKEKIGLFNELRRHGFDIIVDLRNSLFGFLLPAGYKTSPFTFISKGAVHMRDKHLNRIKVDKGFDAKEKSLYISHEDEEYILGVLKRNNIGPADLIVVISPGARSQTKAWPKEKFMSLCAAVASEFKARIFLVGDYADIPISRYISDGCGSQVIDITGRTTIPGLACLIKKAGLVIANDSAVLHLSSYLDVPTIGIFGPTDEFKYGPWSLVHATVKADTYCRPCEEAQCRYKTLDCMKLIKVTDVLNAVRKTLAVTRQFPAYQPIKLPFMHPQYPFERILIVRTDRIGDVILSTPVIKAMRDNYPSSYIAMMVRPYAEEIVEGNPYLDEIILYDKDSAHKSWWESLQFMLSLKQKRFDVAIILHPTNRVHLITFFAGIPRRIGYNMKLGFLLTDRLKHIKQEGQKHEIEYNLDIIRYFRIEPKDKSLYMPIKEESQRSIEHLLKELDIKENEEILAIHPGASCPSKIWPPERFARVADSLIERYGFKVLIVAAAQDKGIANEVAGSMHQASFNVAGRTLISELASLLKRCRLFVSNDSGPVHIASAVGTPVISIFGRSQKGLSPSRWGPVGKKDIILHKEVGCTECLAHNCKKDFACLKAITVDDVLSAADSILKNIQ